VHLPSTVGRSPAAAAVPLTWTTIVDLARLVMGKAVD
jgi:hypothetical protein